MGAWTARWTMPLEPLPMTPRIWSSSRTTSKVAEASDVDAGPDEPARSSESPVSSSAEGGGSTEREASTLERPPPSRELPREPSGMAARGANPSPARGLLRLGVPSPEMRRPAREISRSPSVNVPLLDSSYAARGTFGTWIVTGGRLRLRGIVRVARRRLRRARECAASTRRRR